MKFVQFCVQCGKQVADGNRFCPNCGLEVQRRQQPVSGVKQEPRVQSSYQPYTPQAMPAGLRPTKKRSPVALIVGGIVALAAAVLAVTLIVMPLLEGNQIDNPTETPTIDRELLGVWLPTGLTEQASITVFIADSASQSDINTLIASIGGMPDVEDVVFVSKEEALERFKEMTSSGLADQLDGNPLPASIEIYLKDQKKIVSIAGQIMASREFYAIVDQPDNPSDSIHYGQTLTFEFKEDGTYVSNGDSAHYTAIDGILTLSQSGATQRFEYAIQNDVLSIAGIGATYIDSLSFERLS
jgi:hypothetical protein